MLESISSGPTRWTMLGVPFAFRGPVPGSHHDVKFFGPGLPPLPFPHLCGEMFLADSGYFGYPHMLLPFKKSEDEGKQDWCDIERDESGQAIKMCRVDRSSARPKMKNKTISLRRYWNKAHSKYRSRIERTYAWWLKYACTTQCDKGPEFLKDAFTIMIAWEFFLQQTKGQGHYAKELPSSHDWSTDTWCNCGVYKDPVAARNACSKRRSNAQHLKSLHLVPVPRPPKHRAKDHKPSLLWPMNPPSESDTASSASGDEDER